MVPRPSFAQKEERLMSARFLTLVLCGMLLILVGSTGGVPAEPRDSPPEVQVSRPVAREVADHENFTGRTDAVNSVAIRSRVTGYVVKTPFKEGSEVKKGDVLFEIDPRPYQAQVDQAQAQVELNKAQLKHAEATLARLRALPAGGVGKQELDEAQAAVEEAKARMEASRAALLLYKLNLDYCHITSPIDGIASSYHETAGNLVVQDQTLLTTVVSKDPMYASIDMDERTFLNLRRLIRDGKIKATTLTELPVAVGLGNETEYPLKGKLDFVDNHVDPKTGTIRLRVVLPNGDGQLVPGQFVRVRLTTSEPYKALLVPERAVANDKESKVVFVVNDKDIIESRRVVGSRQDGFLAVREGLKPEDRVIVNIGPALRVRKGETVKPVPAPEEEPPKQRREKP
jgi:RND family efflux transporter MFP subunit